MTQFTVNQFITTAFDLNWVLIRHFRQPKVKKYFDKLYIDYNNGEENFRVNVYQSHCKSVLNVD